MTLKNICAELKTCCSRVPWASALSVFLHAASAIVATGCMLKIIGLINRIVDMSIEPYVGIFLVVILLIDVWYLIIAIFSSGQTRKQCCKQRCFSCIGMGCSVVAILIALVLWLIWSLLTITFLFGVVASLLMAVICKLVDFAASESCLLITSLNITSTSFCGSSAEALCNDVNSGFYMTVGTEVGCAVATFSMVLILMCLTSNYAYQKAENDHSVRDNDDSGIDNIAMDTIEK